MKNFSQQYDEEKKLVTITCDGDHGLTILVDNVDPGNPLALKTITVRDKGGITLVIARDVVLNGYTINALAVFRWVHHALELELITPLTESSRQWTIDHLAYLYGSISGDDITELFDEGDPNDEVSTLPITFAGASTFKYDHYEVAVKRTNLNYCLEDIISLSKASPGTHVTIKIVQEVNREDLPAPTITHYKEVIKKAL